MQTKFKSGLNLFYVLFLSVFQIVILLLLTSPIFADSKVGLRFGVLLFIIDAVLILPMLFFTKYEIGENELIIQDWPLRRYKIPYGDIISESKTASIDVEFDVSGLVINATDITLSENELIF